MTFQGKRILLGVGGGIAVYRAVELMRLLMRQGAEVKVVMTKSAQAFVTPLTFEALSGHKVHHDLFDLNEEHGMGHIQLVRWADAVVIAPATANVIAKISHGIAEDLLTTALLVCEKPVLLAPAMNVSMWEATPTQHNINALKRRGFAVIEPSAGELACGEVGEGRLAEPEMILAAIIPLLTPQILQGQRWVINAGPTVESWDAVRTMSNRATGKLGVLLANAAANAGAEVVLVAGPNTPAAAALVQRFDVESAAQMQSVCEAAASDVDVFVATAAVGDYRFATPHLEKLKRKDMQYLSVELESNPDIVAGIAHMSSRPRCVIAFAAESQNHVVYAKQKLAKKGVDAIVANDVSNMGSNLASGWWLTEQGEESIDTLSKEAFATKLMQYIYELSIGN